MRADAQSGCRMRADAPLRTEPYYKEHINN
jgi:hypothetical protein